MQTAKRNIRIYFISLLLYTVAMNFLRDGYVQAYLLGQGYTTRDISLYGTVGSLAGLAGYALFALFTSFITGDARTSLKILPISALLTCILPPALMVTGVITRGMGLALAGAAIYQLTMAVRTSCEYSTVPALFPRSEYGAVSGKSGIAGSLIAAAISLLSAFLAFMDTDTKYRLFFAASLAALVISALMLFGYRLNGTVEGPSGEERKVSVRPPLKRTVWLLLPHTMRGVASAVFYYFVTVAFGRVTLDSAGQSVFVTLGVVGAMAGCWLFMRLQNRCRTGRMIFVSNIIAALAAAAVCFIRTPAAFFMTYAVHMISTSVTDYAVPAGVIYSVPSHELTFISSTRMFMLNGAVTVFIPIAARCLEAFPGIYVMAAGGLMYIAAGMIFRKQLDDSLKFDK